MRHLFSLISFLALVGLLSPVLVQGQAARLSLDQLPPVYVVAEKSTEVAARGCQLQTFGANTTSFLVNPETPYPVIPADPDIGEDDGQAQIFFCSRAAVDSLTVVGQVSGLVDRIVGAIGRGFAKALGTLGGGISKIVGIVMSIVLWPLAAVMVFFMSLVAMGATYFLSYGTFLTNPVVRAGWPFILGFANLGFVLALLFIALSTVLRIEGFQARRMLPRLLIAALLINFSLIIAVFIIDASRLVMAVVAQGIASPAACAGSALECLPANVLKNSQLVTAAFNIRGDRLLVVSTPALQNLPGVVDTLQSLVIIAVMTLAFMVLFALLAIRWLALIILLVLSPLAYLFVALPGTSKWARMWWEKFIKYVVYGPVIVLVLALFTQAQGPLYDNLQASFDDLNLYAGGQQVGNTGSTVASVLMTGITAAFLIGSVAAGQYLGVLGSQVATQGFKKGLGYAAKPITAPAGYVARDTGRRIARVTRNLPGVKQARTWLAAREAGLDEYERLQEAPVRRAGAKAVDATRAKYAGRYASDEVRTDIQKVQEEAAKGANMAALGVIAAQASGQGIYSAGSLGQSHVAAELSPEQIAAINQHGSGDQKLALAKALAGMPAEFAAKIRGAKVDAILGTNDQYIIEGMVSNSDIVANMENDQQREVTDFIGGRKVKSPKSPANAQVQLTQTNRVNWDTIINQSIEAGELLKIEDWMTDAEQRTVEQANTDARRRWQKMKDDHKDLFNAFHASKREAFKSHYA